MEILHLSNCTRVIGAPDDIKDGSCSGLPVQEYENELGRWCISFWKPSEEEVAQLVNGGVVCLHTRASGRQHPVVAIGTAPLE